VREDHKKGLERQYRKYDSRLLIWGGKKGHGLKGRLKGKHYPNEQVGKRGTRRSIKEGSEGGGRTKKGGYKGDLLVKGH